jgi:pyruvate,water dikinase
MTTDSEPKSFPSPFEVPIPPGCEGWEDMYAYHTPFSDDRRSFDVERFWFQDSLHAPDSAFDTVFDYAVAGVNQAGTRVFAVPPSLGFEYRVFNGYVYLSANSVTDEEMISRRAEVFTRRGGHYYRHWDELYERWVEKMEATIHELEILDVPELPELEDEPSSPGAASARLPNSVAYDRLLGVRCCSTTSSSILGCGAYLVFYEVCRQTFGHPDQRSQRWSSIDSRPAPGRSLRLARLALELGIAEPSRSGDEEAWCCSRE